LQGTDLSAKSQSISTSKFLTQTSNDSRVEQAMGKRLFLVLAAGALLLFQFSDCMSAMTLDQQSMQCCGSMPCTPANHSHGCCKNMVSAQTPNMLPAPHVFLHGPNRATVEYSGTLKIVRSIPTPAVAIDAQQHSPPELYTLHASLLI
jgi:hypothetical protein